MVKGINRVAASRATRAFANRLAVVTIPLISLLVLAFPPAARSVVIIPEESFSLPAPFVFARTQVVASGPVASQQRDTDESTGDTTQSLVATAESGVVPGNDTSTAVHAFGVVRSNPFGGISIGWSDEILGTPVVNEGAGPVELTDRSASSTVSAYNRFRVSAPNGQATDVDIDLTLNGQISFRFKRPLQEIAPADGVGASLQISSDLSSTRYGTQTLFEIDSTPGTLDLGLLGPGQHTLGGLDLFVTDIEDAGQVVGKIVDVTATLSAEDSVFALDGDELGLALSANLTINYFDTDLEYFTAEFDRTLEGLPSADEPGVSFQTVVPLPGAAWLLGSALLGLGACRRRRSRPAGDSTVQARVRE